jgi:hypothetical protein
MKDLKRIGYVGKMNKFKAKPEMWKTRHMHRGKRKKTISRHG